MHKEDYSVTENVLLATGYTQWQELFRCFTCTTITFILVYGYNELAMAVNHSHETSSRDGNLQH